MTNPKHNLKTTLLTGHVEGVSYLLLLFVAMPLKYIYGYPEATKIVGTIHGILFCAYIFFIIESWAKLKWKLGTPVVLFILSLIPFGTFFQRKVIASMEG